MMDGIDIGRERGVKVQAGEDNVDMDLAHRVGDLMEECADRGVQDDKVLNTFICAAWFLANDKGADYLEACADFFAKAAKEAKAGV